MIKIKQSGNFDNTEKFLKRASGNNLYKNLDAYAMEGVEALSASTPKKTGKTASSWYYEIDRSKDGIRISWLNRNISKGVNIAVILQYGHGTRNGGFVQGKDYINPAIKPIFDNIADNVWKELTK